MAVLITDRYSSIYQIVHAIELAPKAGTWSHTSNTLTSLFRRGVDLLYVSEVSFSTTSKVNSGQFV